MNGPTRQRMPPPQRPLRPGRARSVKAALAANLLLPGAGLMCRGRWLAGALCAAGFVGCFVAMIVLFLRGYAAYLRLGTGDLLRGATLEALRHAFPAGPLLVLLLVALAIAVASTVGVACSGRRER